LPIETFHAKLIFADDTLAYVGSANLLNSSEGLSLETGAGFAVSLRAGSIRHPSTCRRFRCRCSIGARKNDTGSDAWAMAKAQFAILFEGRFRLA
jgi:hypothetical protein